MSTATLDSRAASAPDLFRGIQDVIDFRVDARIDYERRVASKDTVLDVGGRNSTSNSHRKLRALSTNSQTQIVSTDVIREYAPDLVDDICNTRIASGTFDGVYCDAILEHVEDYVSAVNNIHKVLKPGGEVFIYVPFFWCFHDVMDYHRFTFTELDRLLRSFSEYRIFLSDATGYGGVFWQVVTFYQIARFPKLWRALSALVNVVISVPLTLAYLLNGRHQTGNAITLSQYRFYFLHLRMNHGFCAWARK
jgi:SAM-dependent methyltransferase